jgi:hypothetical protein
MSIYTVVVEIQCGMGIAYGTDQLIIPQRTTICCALFCSSDVMLTAVHSEDRLGRDVNEVKRRVFVYSRILVQSLLVG